MEETFAVRGNVLKLQNVLKNERAGRVKSKIIYFIHTQTFVSAPPSI